MVMAQITKNDLKQVSTPALSDHYHHARKLYGLFSGLLLLWELVGVEIQETPIENLKLRLMNPEAVPIILFFLVLYFAFRFAIEWSQCDRLRRQIPCVASRFLHRTYRRPGGSINLWFSAGINNPCF